MKRFSNILGFSLCFSAVQGCTASTEPEVDPGADGSMTGDTNSGDSNFSGDDGTISGGTSAGSSGADDESGSSTGDGSTSTSSTSGADDGDETGSDDAGGEEPLTAWCKDEDGDLVGDPSDCVTLEDSDTPPNGYVSNNDDCDDGDERLGRCAIFVTGDGTNNSAYDAGLGSVLVELGYNVEVVDDVDADDDDVPQAAIVVVSETVEAKRVGNEYIDLANPIVCLEGRLWDDMKMTPPGAPSDHRTIEIVDPDSSMAAGLSGSIRVVAGQTGGTYWGEPSASADVIAKTPSNLVVLFRYDAGKTMALGTKAQGPRVGFGVDALPDTGDSALTVEGLWLFRASVVWAAAAD